MMELTILAKKKKRKSKVDKPSDFLILDCGDYFLLLNTRMKFKAKSGHTHLDNYETCEAIINWVCNHKIPYNDYLRESARRVSRDEKYLLMIDIKNDKVRNKQKYYNQNCGVTV